MLRKGVDYNGLGGAGRPAAFAGGRKSARPPRDGVTEIVGSNIRQRSASIVRWGLADRPGANLRPRRTRPTTKSDTHRIRGASDVCGSRTGQYARGRGRGEYSYRGDRFTFKGQISDEMARMAAIMCRATTMSEHMQVGMLEQYCPLPAVRLRAGSCAARR